MPDSLCKSAARTAEKTLRIAFFCWESVYSVKVGGLAPAATHLAERLARTHTVHFFTRGTGNDETIENVHYHYANPSGPHILAYCQDLSVQLLAKFQDLDDPPFDIIHVHDWHCVDALHKLRDRVTVLSYHSTEYGRNGSAFGDWWEFKEISGKEWYGGCIARRITTVSKHTKTEVMWLYNVPEWKVSVIPNGIDPERYYEPVDPAEVKKKYGIHPLVPMVLFVGRLVYQKGPDLLIEAIPRVLEKRRDVQFIFAGDGTMGDWLKERAEGLPVRFTGFLSDAGIRELMNAADLMVIPSRNEPFGLVLTEAWSAGRCVVATDVGGLAENIENFVDGIKVPVRADSIAWGINYVIDDPRTIRALGRAGRLKVSTEFDWDLVAASVMRVYDAAIRDFRTSEGG